MTEEQLVFEVDPFDAVGGGIEILRTLEHAQGVLVSAQQQVRATE